MRTTEPVLTPEEMRRAEKRLFDRGFPEILLMEHAAMAVTDELETLLGGSCAGKTALFLCGTGNNGGDGYAAARLFTDRGGRAAVLTAGEPKTENARLNMQLLERQGVLFCREYTDASDIQGLRPDAVVDAVFGIGFHGVPAGKARALIALCNDFRESGVPVLSVDVPSGLNAQTGKAEACVRADVTVTFHAMKPGLLLSPHREAVGRVAARPIGIPEDGGEAPIQMIARPALAALKNRPLNAQKGDCGRVLIYAGSMGMLGAAAMCARAAISAGAGLTTILCEKEEMPVLQALAPCAMCREIHEALNDPRPYDVLALGCGLSQSGEKWQNILRLWNPEKPSVWDADALNMLAAHPMQLGAKALITPHPGEAARLLCCSVADILQDRLAAAKALCEKYGCVTLLKSDVTVACEIKDGKPRYYLNAVGTPALAKGGSGDVLAGIAAALRCENAYTAALASLWHGAAGQIGEKRFGLRELTPEQLITCLHEAEEMKTQTMKCGAF